MCFMVVLRRMKLSISDDGGKRITAIQRGFEVVDVLRRLGTVRIKDVADELEIPTSTAHVNLKMLESIGYFVQNEDGYRLGLRSLRDGSVARNAREVYVTAKSETDALAEKTLLL